VLKLQLVKVASSVPAIDSLRARWARRCLRQIGLRPFEMRDRL
jgi:hypothetical protein